MNNKAETKLTRKTRGGAKTPAGVLTFKEKLVDLETQIRPFVEKVLSAHDLSEVQDFRFVHTKISDYGKCKLPGSGRRPGPAGYRLTVYCGEHPLPYAHYLFGGFRRGNYVRVNKLMRVTLLSRAESAIFIFGTVLYEFLHGTKQIDGVLTQRVAAMYGIEILHRFRAWKIRENRRVLQSTRERAFACSEQRADIRCSS